MQEISIVIPVFNDADVIKELFLRLKATLNLFNFPCEIILVDDGSRDNSLSQIDEHAGILAGYELRIISMMRNFGQMAALTAGIENAQGKYTVLMDCDLQDRPEDIEALYKKIKNSKLPMIICKRKSRDDSFIKKLGSNFFHYLSTKFINLKFPTNAGVFRIFETSYYQKIAVLSDSTTPPLSLMYWAGIKYDTIKLDRDKRFAGKSGYNLSSMVSLALDRIFSYSTTPIRLATYLGIVIGLISIVTSIVLVARKILYGGIVPGWTTTIVILLLTTSINLFFLGIIGEYLSRVYQETKKRPKYVIDSIKSLNKEGTSGKIAS